MWFEILLDWTPIFEQYVARLLLKNRYQNDMCYNDIGLSFKIYASVWSNSEHNWEVQLFKEKDNFHFDLYFIFQKKLLFDNVHDSQLLVRWQNSWAYPTVINVFGVRSAHNRTKLGVGNVVMMWELPTPQIMLVVGSNCELSHLVNILEHVVISCFRTEIEVQKL